MKMIRAALVCIAALAIPAHAQKQCSKADAAAAEKTIDRVVNYGQLHKAWKDYAHCDSGPIEDLYTDAILRLMVEWKNVETVVRDMQKDPEYKAFVHRHLLSPAAKDDRMSVHSRAKMSCPPLQDAFCAELVELLKPVK